jgi:hypothetical protein
MKIRALFSCALVFLASCGSTIVVIEKGYEAIKIKDASIAVMVRNNPPDISYSGDVEPEFGPGDQNILIFDYFKTSVVEYIKNQTWLSPVQFKDVPVDPAVMGETRELKLPNGSVIEVALPRPGSVFQFADFLPVFVLIIDNLFIGTSMQTNSYWAEAQEPPSDILEADACLRIERAIQFPATGTFLNQTMAFTPPMMPPPQMFNPPMMHSSTTKNLTYEADISIWDNTAKTLVAYGHVKSVVGSSFIPVVTMGTWKQVTSSFVSAIFDKTPFARGMSEM